MFHVNFDNWVFEFLAFPNGLGGDIFTSPNTAAIMSSGPAAQGGAASGVRADVLQRRLIVVDRCVLLVDDRQPVSHAAVRPE